MVLSSSYFKYVIVLQLQEKNLDHCLPQKGEKNLEINLRLRILPTVLSNKPYNSKLQLCSFVFLSCFGGKKSEK